MRVPLVRRSLAAAAAAVLVSGAAGTALGSPPEASVPCLPLLDEATAGVAAAAALGPDLPDVARANGRSAAELRRMLLDDDALHVDTCGALVFVDPDLGTGAAHHGGEAGAARAAAGPPVWTLWTQWDPTEALAASADVDVFALHSRRGERPVIHLDFDGAAMEPWWRSLDFYQEGGAFEPFDADGDPTSFSILERAAVYEIWSRVSEDFAPFDVDVTTEQPAVEDLLRSSRSDQRYGTTVVVTQTGSWPSGGGIGRVDTFGGPDSEQAAVTFAGSDDRRRSPEQIATVSSHEAGHTLGLGHHGGDQQAYDPGNAMWAPIMGDGPGAMTHWADGSWDGATNPGQADIEVMTGPPYEHLRLAAGPVDDGSQVSLGVPVDGLIRSRDESHTWTVAANGPVRVRVSVARFGPNLDPQVTVLDRNGRTVAVLDPELVEEPLLQRPGSLDIDQVLHVTGGILTLVVEGVGGGDPRGAVSPRQYLGYSDYGSLGRYTLRVDRAVGGACGSPARTASPCAPSTG